MGEARDPASDTPEERMTTTEGRTTRIAVICFAIVEAALIGYFLFART